jgi:hypothetical protein
MAWTPVGRCKRSIRACEPLNSYLLHRKVRTKNEAGKTTAGLSSFGMVLE